jgi:hypothetical protein
MARKRAAPRQVLLPKPGDTFLMPLEDGSFGVCRVLRESTAAELKRHGCPHVLVAASTWMGTKVPDIGDRRLRKIHRLTHHSWKNAANVCWVSDPVPASFRRLGVIKPTAVEKRWNCMASGGWAFGLQVYQQWRWDHDREAVLRDDNEARELQKRQSEESLKQTEKRLAGLTLEALQKKRRFSAWKGSVPPAALTACRKIFRETIAALIELGPKPKTRPILGILRQCIESLNDLDQKQSLFVTTIEREDLCDEFDEIVHASGLRGYENLADRWRDW